MRRALCEKRSGLTPCDFETARIDTYVGTVPALDDLRVRPDLLDYDCRNNRLAQFCLEQDGFAGQVAAARDRYGAGRIGFYLGTSTSGLHATELAYRRRTRRPAPCLPTTVMPRRKTPTRSENSCGAISD